MGRAPTLEHGDAEAKLVVTRRLPGQLVLGRLRSNSDASRVDQLRPAGRPRLPPRSSLEKAFLDGYGPDPREKQAWHRSRVREAISTAAWAYRVGDESFEAQGHRMIADALGRR